MFTTLFLLALRASTGLSASIAQRATSTSDSVWGVKNFANLITFGDSYTDEDWLQYLIAHNGASPPTGYLLPEGFMSASGGQTWPRFVVQYTGTTVDDQWKPQLELYDYAVSGAVCSNLITPRYLAAINMNFPSVIEYEIPIFKLDQSANRNGTNQPYFTVTPTASNTVYSLWIGTNDLGVDCFLTDSQVPGKVLTDYTECIYQAFDELYAAGGRVFVLMNTIPLQLAPLYANATLFGTTAANSTYWPNKPSNLTQIAETMHEYTTTVNTIFKYQTPFEHLVAKRYPGASWALFDVWSLISDIYDSPGEYFNGTEPPDVTGAEKMCNGDGSVCSFAFNRTSSDSFMWFDSLHPSVQTDRIIAREFVDVLGGGSRYATYY